MPIIGNMFQLIVEPLKRSGSSLSDNVRLRPVTVAMSANARVRAFQSCTSRYEALPRSSPLAWWVVWSDTRPSGSLNGNGLMAMVSTTLKIVLFTPMPSARQAMVSVAKPGFFTSVLAA